MSSALSLPRMSQAASSLSSAPSSAPIIGRDEVSPEQWNDWRWQQRNAITSYEELKALIPLTAEEEAGVKDSRGLFRLGISPYYFSLIDKNNSYCPVRMQAIPTVHELSTGRGDRIDPLGEDDHSPTTGLVHRYPDRVLFLVVDRCSVYCRYCTRRRMVGGESDINRETLKKGLEYLREHKEIRDVLVSGGDPLILATHRLEEILKGLREIPHIEIIRIGTRMPVVNPMRITDELCSMLRKYHPIWINTHFNHPKEVTPEAVKACGMLVDAGIPMGNQTVLLRRVNSSARVIKKLCHELLKARVRPYYLFQCDPAQGLEHFRTPVGKGIEIIEALRGHTTGFSIPTFVVDCPGGGGKISLQPNYVLSPGVEKSVLRNFEGKVFEYYEPTQRDCTVPYEEVFFEGQPDREPLGPAGMFWD
jgi:lysine 2,3-aminomutase